MGSIRKALITKTGGWEMKTSYAEAAWNGGFRDGGGTMRLGSGAFEGSYTYLSRFEEGAGTNPEELIAAAHAGCFSMALTNDLGKAGYQPQQVRTKAQIRLEKVEGRSTITRIHLDTEARVPGIEAQAFQQIAEGAKKGCPVSRALAGVEISMDAKLLSE
jgi:osmotically inducible protein OsmC